MRKFARVVMIVSVLGGCGSEGKASQDASNTPIDSETIDAPSNPPVDMAEVDAFVEGACDPLAPAGQQGCASGRKCTWISVDDENGKIGCADEGSVALGGACTTGPVGETTGYDDCAAGGICIMGVCKDLCGFDGSATAACAAGMACTRYAGIGANGDDSPVIGVCNESCDPLTQTRIVNGSPESCGQGKGCYLLSNATDTIAVCAGAGTVAHNLPINGTVYANSCVPGHVARQAVQGESAFECASLCKPADVYMGNNEAYEGGNSTVTNYANMPATCESAGGATVRPEVPTTGESCQYFWTRESTTGLTAFSNTIGWCFNHASWKYDPDGMEPINNTADYPRCITTTTGDVIPPNNGTESDAQYFGCTALPTSFVSSEKPTKFAVPKAKVDRLSPPMR